MAAKRSGAPASILDMLASPGGLRVKTPVAAKRATVLQMLASPAPKPQPPTGGPTPSKVKGDDRKRARSTTAPAAAAEAKGDGKKAKVGAAAASEASDPKVPAIDSATGKKLQKRVADKKNKEEERQRAAELLQAHAGKFAATLEDREEEPSDAAEEVEDETWDAGRRRQLAETAWAPPASGACAPPDSLISPAFDPSAALQHRSGARTEFGLLTSFLDLAISGAAPTLCAIANIIRLVMRHSSEPQADVTAMVTVLLAGNRKVFHRHLAEAAISAFGLKVQSGKSVNPDDLPDISLEGRAKQRVLFATKRVLVADVAAVLEEYASLTDEVASEGRHCGQAAKFQSLAEERNLPARLVKLLGSSVAEGRETWHLVRVLQGNMGFSWDLVIRGLAHAVVLARRTPAQVAACTSDLAEDMLEMEDAMLRAYAQDGGKTGRLVKAVVAGVPAEALPLACPPLFGSRVLPMRAEAAKDIAGALEKVAGGAVLAEFLMMGERGQVHVRGGGKQVKVFTAHQGSRASAEEVAAMLAGHLVNVDSCIMEVIFPPRRKNQKLDGPQDNKEQAASTEATSNHEANKEGEKGVPVLSMVVFDLLMLNGASLTEAPLRERRAKLVSAVRQSTRLKLVRSSELSKDEATPENILAKLDEALSASYLATDEDKATTRAFGLVLKRLDGPLSAYIAGRPFGLSWQALERPAVVGPEADRLLYEALTPEERAVMPAIEDIYFTVVSGFRTRTVEGITDILRIQKFYNDAGVVPVWYVDNECPEEYRKLGLQVVKAGKLIPARNLALEDAFKAGKMCVQTSDDIGCWQFLNDASRYNTDEEANAASKRVEKFNVSPVAAARFLAAKMKARGPNCRLGGVYPLGNSGRAMRAFASTNNHFILGDFFVADVSDIRFDERLSLKEDYDFTASHLDKFGEVFRSNRMIITAKHETNAGGACDVRDAAGKREQYNIGILREKWPGCIHDHPTRANQIVLRWKSRKSKQQEAAADGAADGSGDAEAPEAAPAAAAAAAETPAAAAAAASASDPAAEDASEEAAGGAEGAGDAVEAAAAAAEEGGGEAAAEEPEVEMVEAGDEEAAAAPAEPEQRGAAEVEGAAQPAEEAEATAEPDVPMPDAPTADAPMPEAAGADAAPVADAPAPGAPEPGAEAEAAAVPDAAPVPDAATADVPMTDAAEPDSAAPADGAVAGASEPVVDGTEADAAAADAPMPAAEEGAAASLDVGAGGEVNDTPMDTSIE